MGWIDQVSDISISLIAGSLGMQERRMQSLSPCPSCDRVNRGSKDNRGAIGLTPNGKGWRCHRCAAGGNAIDLVSYCLHKSKMRDASKEEMSMVRDWFVNGGFVTLDTVKNNMYSPMGAARGRPLSAPKLRASQDDTPKKPEKPSSFDWEDGKGLECHEILMNGKGVQRDACLEYLMSRGFNETSLRFWEIGCFICGSNRLWITIPLKNEHGQTVSIRYRSVPSDKYPNKEYRVCRARPLPLYGAHTLSGDYKSTVIIVEGELDVMSLYQYGITQNVVSGTKGAASNWTEEWLDLLEPYSNFIILYDNDDAGKKGASKLADALGTYRCSVAVLPRNDANECLQNGDSENVIHRALDRSKPVIKLSYSKPSDYGSDLEILISNPDALRGRATGSDRLDEAIGGLRDELVVVTGDTGHGKTTLTTWMCLEQARQGVPVLLTSFEQRPIGTVQKLLRAQMGGDFTQATSHQRKLALEELDKLPIIILNHYGEASFDQVYDAIRYASRRYGVKCAQIDHLGFLTRGAGDKERQVIEEVIRKLALIAVNDGLTILLICHPNRMSKAQQRRIQIGDLKGASAIEQDAHMGLVVERLQPSNQRGFPCCAIHVDKVRSEFGHPSSTVTLCFDPLSSVFADRWEYTPSGAKGLKIQVQGG